MDGLNCSGYGSLGCDSSYAAYLISKDRLCATCREANS